MKETRQRHISIHRPGTHIQQSSETGLQKSQSNLDPLRIDWSRQILRKTGAREERNKRTFIPSKMLRSIFKSLILSMDSLRSKLREVLLSVDRTLFSRLKSQGFNDPGVCYGQRYFFRPPFIPVLGRKREQKSGFFTP